MKKVLIVLAVIILFIAGVYYFLGDNYESLYKKYSGLIEPGISMKIDQKVLEYKAIGDPNLVARKAFSELFKAYYSLKGVDKLSYVAPRARWPEVEVTKKGEWVGFYAVPVPDPDTELPQNIDPNIKRVIWKYGMVAEILHVGPYAEETPAIEKLKAFISAGGYKITGDHEEEYLRGPGVFGAGNTKKYLTIIRYRVVKVEPVKK